MSLSGPMFEPAEWGEFKSLFGKTGAHYNIFNANGIGALKNFFPDAEADEMNFVLFSTSGVHGTYNTIEESERFLRGKLGLAVKDEEGFSEITFLIVQPRIVCLRYGAF